MSNITDLLNKSHLQKPKKIDTKIIYEKFNWIFQKDKNCIISPDSDGIMCALLMSKYLNWKVKGFYDGQVLLFQKDDEFGNGEFDNCLSPNQMRGYDKKFFRLKFPLATVHFLISILYKHFDIKLSERAIYPLLFTDGLFKQFVIRIYIQQIAFPPGNFITVISMVEFCFYSFIVYVCVCMYALCVCTFDG